MIRILLICAAVNLAWCAMNVAGLVVMTNYVLHSTQAREVSHP